MKRLLQLLLILTYPFLVFSALLPVGLVFAVAFLADFTVENRTGQPVVITPVGTIGPEGDRSPLPVMLAPCVPWPAFYNGGYRLAHGETLTIWYDWDDINFSELVVEDEPGRQRQLVTDPTPTERQYHPPLQSHFVIENLEQLPLASPEVKEVAARSQGFSLFGVVLAAILVGPWLVYAALRWALG